MTSKVCLNTLCECGENCECRNECDCGVKAARSSASTRPAAVAAASAAPVVQKKRASLADLSRALNGEEDGMCVLAGVGSGYMVFNMYINGDLCTICYLC